MPDCQYCGSERVIPVLDKNIEERDKPGNKYRRLCESCERFGHMASGDEFRSHDGAKVIPVGEPRDYDHAVPKAAYESGGQPEVAADGNGETDAEDEPANEFDCPACSAHVTGYPDECPDCEVPFEWGDEQ